MQVLQHFECYKDIKEISSLRDQVCQIRTALGAQILSDFKESFGGKGGPPVRTLADACAVVDALEPKVKKELLHWFINMQLQVCGHFGVTLPLLVTFKPTCFKMYHYAVQ